MTGATKTTHSTEAVKAFVTSYSKIISGEGPQAVRRFRDGTEVKHRDVYKLINTKQMQALGGDEAAISMLTSLAGIKDQDVVIELTSLVKKNEKLETLVSQTAAELSTLPRFSKAVYVALYTMLYAEPGFSDVTVEQIAQKLRVDMQQVKGALSGLSRRELIFEDATNGQKFQHPVIWSNEWRAEITLKQLGFDPEVVADLIEQPFKADRSTNMSDDTNTTSTPTEVTQEVADTNVEQQVAQDVVEEISPEDGSKASETPAATPKQKKEKAPAAPKALTEEEQEELKSYTERYAKRGENELDLTTVTKTGAKSRMSLEARARMALAAKKRWSDPEKRAALEATMAKRKEATAGAREEKAAAKKKAQEERQAKAKEQRDAEKARKADEKAKADKKAAAEAKKNADANPAQQDTKGKGKGKKASPEAAAE